MQQQCSGNDIVHFMNETQSFMDGADFVERYAWFGAMEHLPQGVNPVCGSLMINDIGSDFLLGQRAHGY